MVQCKRFSTEFKKRVALSALKEDKTLNELGRMAHNTLAEYN